MVVCVLRPRPYACLLGASAKTALIMTFCARAPMRVGAGFYAVRLFEAMADSWVLRTSCRFFVPCFF